MSKYQIIDIIIILGGVTLAWGMACRGNWHFKNEMYKDGIYYFAVALFCLLVVFYEAIWGVY